MERLDFSEQSSYNAVECAIHLNRYLTAKQYVVGKRVLDVACGEGYGTRLMKNWGAESAVGVDISDEAIQVANRQFAGEGITFLAHSAEELPFEKNSFDVVVSFETIEHLPNPEKFLGEIKRVVKPGGVVIISCPNDDYYAKNLDSYENPYHLCRYSWSDFRELTEKYLGIGERWFLGFALKGFSTIPMMEKQSSETEGLPLRMTVLLNYSTPESSAILREENAINAGNSCYYVGIWGATIGSSDGVAAFYPEAFFSGEEEKKYLRRKIESLEKKVAVQKKELHKLSIEKERVENLRCVAETEKRYLWKRIDSMLEQNRVKDQILGSKAMRLVSWFWKIRDRLFRRR